MLSFPFFCIFKILVTKLLVFFVFGRAQGGELFDRILTYGKFTEPQSRDIFGQIFDALKYLHERNIVHRDLKPGRSIPPSQNPISQTLVFKSFFPPENILMLSKSPHDTSLKLVDFGLSKCMTNASNPLSTLCGTPHYAAPELLTPPVLYGKGVDMWSAGVILYIWFVFYLLTFVVSFFLPSSRFFIFV
jgi:serine/threonine protein kinase